MLVIARRMGQRADGSVESVIVNERWTISVTGMEVVTKPLTLRLRALQEYATPYRFTVRIADAQDGTERDVHLFCRNQDDEDDGANVIVLKHHGHRLTVFMVRLRGEIARLGFEGKHTVFTIRRSEVPV